VVPVRYELHFYIAFRRNSVFKGLNLLHGVIPQKIEILTTTGIKKLFVVAGHWVQNTGFTEITFFLRCLFQPTEGLGPLFSSVIIFTRGETPWASDQPVARPLPKHRTTQTQNKHIYTKHPCPKCDSNPRSQGPDERRQFMR
jgi:hypothetical protein